MRSVSWVTGWQHPSKTPQLLVPSLGASWAERSLLWCRYPKERIKLTGVKYPTSERYEPLPPSLSRGETSTQEILSCLGPEEWTPLSQIEWALFRPLSYQQPSMVPIISSHHLKSPEHSAINLLSLYLSEIILTRNFLPVLPALQPKCLSLLPGCSPAGVCEGWAGFWLWVTWNQRNTVVLVTHFGNQKSESESPCTPGVKPSPPCSFMRMQEGG